MNEPKHKNCIAERDWLRRDNERLRAQLADANEIARQAVEQARAATVENETRKYRATVFADAAFEAKYEAAKKVADAAVMYDKGLTVAIEASKIGKAKAECDAVIAIFQSLLDAAREYRQMNEGDCPAGVRIVRMPGEWTSRPCLYEFSEPEPSPSNDEPCNLGHDNPNARQRKPSALAEALKRLDNKEANDTPRD